jgi:predicted dehydrogenase
LVSDDDKKLKELGKRYKVEGRYHYSELEKCLQEQNIQAVYIALPNNLHKEYTIRAAKTGVHVLCEKPLAISVKECEEMIEACEEKGVHLMTAYRLHFEEANMEAVRLVEKGKIGEPIFFNSLFSFQIKDRNIRLEKELGGGALFDIGIYCINAARYLFRAEPESVFAQLVQGDERFEEVEGTCAALLRFPGDKIAQFTCSFAASNTSQFEVIGTKGKLKLDPAYEYSENLKLEITLNDKSKERRFKRSDQFAAELLYFSECIKKGAAPEPSGREGLADLRIIEALRESAKSGKIVKLPPYEKRSRPWKSQVEAPPPVPEEPELVKAESAVQEE